MSSIDASTVQGIRQALQNRDFGKAEAQARRALAWPPFSVEIQLLLAQALDEQGKIGEVQEWLAKAVQSRPDLAETNLIYGLWLQSKGDFDEARGYLEHSLQIQPNQGMAFLSLVRCGKLSESQRSLTRRMREIAGSPSLQPLQRGYLYYALGKGLEDLEDYRDSMEAYDEANRLFREMRPDTQGFDQSRQTDMRDRIRSYFTREFLLTNRGLGSQSERPIFVVGMPRSGTTLVEQMLSSHSDVGAAGELPFWPMRGDSAIDRSTGLPDLIRSRQLADEYDELLRSMAPWAKHVTDKMPINYLHLGLINMMFPNARVVHIRRSPIDTCLSIYTTDYRTPPEYAYNRENIVFAYRQYEVLTDHWRESLPAQSMIEVRYESLIDEPEQEIRRVLSFCGLEFQEACLHPEKNRRSIRTPSLWQARQPVYKSSRERWRRFEPWLGPFRELLGKDHSELS